MTQAPDRLARPTDALVGDPEVKPRVVTWTVLVRPEARVLAGGTVGTADTTERWENSVVTHTMHGRYATQTPRARGQADNAVGVPGQWRSRSNVGAPMATTVLVADPDRETRRVLTDGLLEAGVGRVIEADSVSAVDDILRAGSPGHLALLSLGFGASANRLIQGLRQAPWARVIALAPTADVRPVLGAIEAGACGVLRGRPGAEAAIPDLAKDLSARELEVLKLVADGHSNKQIAEELSLSALTVKSHLARVSRKLGTGDRSHLVAIAMRAGMLA